MTDIHRMHRSAAELPPPVEGRPFLVEEPHIGALQAYESGPREASGTSPVLLVHSVNAAASAYEMKPVFERECGRRRVYAPDLPGFGCSGRGPRDYTVTLYVDALHDVLETIAPPPPPTRSGRSLTPFRNRATPTRSTYRATGARPAPTASTTRAS